MKKFFAKIGLTLTLTAGSALAMAVTTTNAHAWSIQDIVTTSMQVSTDAPLMTKDVRIAVARMDGGRFIPTPHGESADWQYLDQRVSAQISEMDPSEYYKHIPDINFQAQDTMNKIDEIRLTAANNGQDFVVIYGVGPDASWAGFGKKDLSTTGLTFSKDCGSSDCETWKAAKAKALLVDSFSGEVLGAVTAEDVDFNIGQLADRVGDLILELSA